MKRRETVFDIREFVGLILRSRKVLASIIFASTAIFVAASFVIPKRYKATGTLSVQTDFFRFPLIEEFLPSPNDPAEILSKRDALVRSVLSHDFLDKLGDKYGLFKTQGKSPARNIEIEALAARFEIFSLSQTVVQVGFQGPTAAKTQAVVEDTMAEIVRSLREYRLQKIVRARDNILAQTDRVSLKLDPTKAVFASRKPEVLRAELARLEDEKETLTKRFSDKHPSVRRLEERARALSQYLASTTPKGNAPAFDSPVLDADALPTGSPELYQGLVKKLAYLNIAVSLESDPRASYVNVLEPAGYPLGALWPNKPLFLVWGFLFGLVLSSVVLLVNEARLGTGIHRRWADEAELPLLGELPPLPLGESSTAPRDPPTRPQSRGGFANG